MTDLTLYLDLLSQPCRSVYIFAKANNIPFNNHQVRLFKGEHLSEEFGKVNPFRKVPSLKDGDFTMAESTAILLYLANKYKTPDHWYPADLQKRARVDEYLAWQHTNTRPHGSKLFWIKVMTPLILGYEAEPEKLEPVVTEFNNTLTALEEQFLRGKPFVAGDEISIADLVAIVEIMQPVACGIEAFENKPNLAAWKKRVEDAIGAELFKEAHENVLRVKEMQNMPLPPELKERLKGRLLQFLR
ncbi:PREDICTED: glutathione S-transferase theta-2B [Nanorana parkeri]|uniref:glutathione S-transferase theta-2B n=1 Tax=Nanorana parkeri TaxID=125878 RepID=UPI0008550540|nr:PREDICTED: glutathione S-transferase theta-2B [Nanorana parkeri]